MNTVTNAVQTEVAPKLLRKIVVSRYAAPVVKPTKHSTGPFTFARVRERWQAQYVEGETVRESVDGHLTFDDAIGALIRQMARQCETADQVVDLIAGLFSDLAARTPNVSLSRAVWIAARSKRRRHRGISVVFPHGMHFSGVDKVTVSASRSEKGGAA